MKRILVPFTTAELGGSQLSFFRLAELLKSDYIFDLWFFNSGPFIKIIKDAGYHHTLFNYSTLRTPWGLSQLKKILKKNPPDYIYLHSSRMISYLAKKLNIPCIEKINMTRQKNSGGWCRYPILDRFFSNLNAKLLVVSKSIKEQMIKRGISAEKIDYLHTFIHLDQFKNNDNRHKTRMELNIPQKAILVLNIGRMVEQKGQQDFIAVAELCVQEDNNIHFLIVGEGPLENTLKELVRTKNITSNFHFSSFRDDIENMYHAADIFVHCAHWEPLANVLLEARASGKAIVASDVDGTSEALENYPYCDIVRVEDIKTMTQKTLSWAHNVPCLKAPELPEKFTPEGARKQFMKIFSCQNNDSNI